MAPQKGPMSSKNLFWKKVFKDLINETASLGNRSIEWHPHFNSTPNTVTSIFKHCHCLHPTPHLDAHLLQTQATNRPHTPQTQMTPLNTTPPLDLPIL